jgi:hypothetical protein
MQCGVSMVYRFGLATILLSLSSCASSDLMGPTTTSAWSFSDDVHHYSSHVDDAIGYKVLSAPMTYAGLNKSYQSVAAEASMQLRHCKLWLVLQVIDAYDGEIDSKWLCRQEDHWGSGVFGVKGSRQFIRPISMEIPSDLFEDVTALLRRAEPYDYSRFTTLDGSAAFVTYYDGSMVRRALYNPVEASQSDAPLESDDRASLSAFDVAYQRLTAISE